MPVKKSTRPRKPRPSRRRATESFPLLKVLGAVAVVAAIVLGAVWAARFLSPPEPRPTVAERQKPARRDQAPAVRPPVAERKPENPPPAPKPSAPAPPVRNGLAEKPAPPRSDSDSLHASLPPLPPEPPEVKKLPRVALIIDDLGYDRQMAEKLMDLNAPLTLAILPHSPHQKRIAHMAHARGFEVILHLPMEPVEYPEVQPGPGTLLASMSPDERLQELERDLDAVPHIKGANNHMGSKLTARPEPMQQVFSVLKRRGLFFIDSRTTDESICRPSARLLQIPFAQRDVFLDHAHDPASIRKQIRELVRLARFKGEAVGIGHPHPATYSVLREELPWLREQVELVPASALVRVVQG